MLGDTAAAHPEMRTGRRAPGGRSAKNLGYAGAIEFGLGLEQPCFDQLARKCAFDEHDLARLARDAAPGGIERVDFKNHSRAAGILASAACRGSANRPSGFRFPCRTGPL